MPPLVEKRPPSSNSDRAVVTRDQRLRMHIVSLRDRAKRMKPEAIDTDGRLALSVLATAYDSEADELEAILKEKSWRPPKKRLTFQ